MGEAFTDIPVQLAYWPGASGVVPDALTHFLLYMDATKWPSGPTFAAAPLLSVGPANHESTKGKLLIQL